MGYALSDNPPAPRPTLFRHGDWICLCAAHNFGRNTRCIACGTMKEHSLPPKPSHPLLTPSGRAFAVGGRVQNVSSDPLNPCIMYWPDNEPFPEQSQIRPSNVVGVAPPILNTGNRGPISHQPGDWICGKCNYLNWRRRKVCQTCLPYAEGNGDSISAAVQAERIALLTQVLSQASPHLPPHVPSPASSMGLTPPLGMGTRTNTLTPPQVRSQSYIPAHGNTASGGRPPSLFNTHNSPFTTSATSSGTQHALGFPGNHSASNPNSHLDATVHQLSGLGVGQGHVGHGGQGDMRQGHGSVQGRMARSRSHVSLRGPSPLHHSQGLGGGLGAGGGMGLGGGPGAGGRMSPMIYQTGHPTSATSTPLSTNSALPPGVGQRSGRAATLNLGHGHGHGMGLGSSMHAPSVPSPHPSPLYSQSQRSPLYQQSERQQHHLPPHLQTQQLQHERERAQGQGHGLQSSMHAPPSSLHPSLQSSLPQQQQHAVLQQQHQRGQQPPHRRQTVPSSLHPSLIPSFAPQSHSPLELHAHPRQAYEQKFHLQDFEHQQSSHLPGFGPSHQQPQEQQLYATGPLPGAFSHPPSVASSVAGGTSKSGSPEPQLAASLAHSQAERGRRCEDGEHCDDEKTSGRAFAVLDDRDRDVMGLAMALRDLPLRDRLPHLTVPPQQPQEAQTETPQTLYSTSTSNSAASATPREHPEVTYRSSNAEALCQSTPLPPLPHTASSAQGRVHAPAPAALLPAFLQDLIHAQSQFQGQSQESRVHHQDAQYAGMGFDMGMGVVQSPPSLSPASARSGSASETSSELHEHAPVGVSSAPAHTQLFDSSLGPRRQPRVSSGSTDSEGSRVGGGMASIWSPGAFGEGKNGVAISSPFGNGTNGSGSGSGSERSSPRYRNGGSAVGKGMFGATPFAATPTAFGHGVGVIGMGRVR